MANLCYGCKTFKDIGYIEPGTGLEYCHACRQIQPFTLEDLTYFFLTYPGSPYGPRFAPGDVVEARVAGVLYDGIGVIEEMSTDLEHGGTPIYPTFKVVFTEKANETVPDFSWYTENCMTKVDQKQEVSSD